jgi:long-subunit acyl-CoA synthetase (AMP-forming)
MNIGCVITHESFMCALFGLAMAVDIMIMLKTKEIPRVLNYMPLAHMFGCGAIVAVTYLGLSPDTLMTRYIFALICRWRSGVLAR